MDEQQQTQSSELTAPPVKTARSPKRKRKRPALPDPGDVHTFLLDRVSRGAIVSQAVADARTHFRGIQFPRVPDSDEATENTIRDFFADPLTETARQLD